VCVKKNTKNNIKMTKDLERRGGGVGGLSRRSVTLEIKKMARIKCSLAGARMARHLVLLF